MTPTDAIDWCIRRNADAPTCAKLREILPAVAAYDSTNRALLESVADLEKELDAARADAARYQHLFASSGEWCVEYNCPTFGWSATSKADADMIIDAATRERKHAV